MNYQQTLDYLYSQLPMFSRMGSAAFKKDLTNIRLLCEHLGNPQAKFKSIHVGGTNGKGSVSHMLAAVMQQSGRKTGLYTSPHLYDFRERIRIDGQMISEEFVIHFVQRIQPLIEKIEPSFFEITVAMAFDFFAKEEIDVAIIEVGLGGRLDSTNIITPELAVITNIGWDHMNMLGSDLPSIAAEKAGIIKTKIPVVIGETVAETKLIFLKAASEKQAPIHFAENELTVTAFKVEDEMLTATYMNGAGEEMTVKTDLSGIYQVQNIRTVLTALNVLNANGWKLQEQIILSALQQVKKATGLMGRWDIIHQHPSVILEVAHNKDGILKMLQHLQLLSYETLHIVIGMVKDKDVEAILQLLPPNARYYFTQAQIPRALPSGELLKQATSIGLKGQDFLDVNDALQMAIDQSSAEDIILICGSIFLVAEVDKEKLKIKTTLHPSA